MKKKLKIRKNLNTITSLDDLTLDEKILRARMVAILANIHNTTFEEEDKKFNFKKTKTLFEDANGYTIWDSIYLFISEKIYIKFFKK